MGRQRIASPLPLCMSLLLGLVEVKVTHDHIRTLVVQYRIRVEGRMASLELVLILQDSTRQQCAPISAMPRMNESHAFDEVISNLQGFAEQETHVRCVQLVQR